MILVVYINSIHCHTCVASSALGFDLRKKLHSNHHTEQLSMYIWPITKFELHKKEPTKLELQKNELTKLELHKLEPMQKRTLWFWA